ncbi:ABC transporter substrate-binding protein [Allostreptomyces psammosilenae]|uniref:Peptide/nickel transport system substrate-binding protein n=1 Tax=Allostreptomyces psammosilenae TaxID=1892865 RepID=A0A853A025_9ACTN|nr:ABC transporter substrate-binding protein [Allostreptomyces psammosilenae]NYI03872.1 peptide/nickel transport system substrate-binding protein [Allostreptomyces psammosilenae]
MRPTRRALPAVALTLTASLLLTGCFASSPGTDAGPAEGAADGRIRVAMLQPPRSGLSPFSDDAFKLSRWSTAETLVVLDEAGDPQPALATEWTRNDPRTWTFTIRQGVTFHDGSPLTADAVAGALRAATEASPKPRILDGVELRISAEGDTVTVTTGEDDPLLPQRLSSPQLSILAPSAYTGATVNPVGTGTGPFVLTEVDGTTAAHLDRYEEYWGEPARAGGIDVTFVPDGTARAAALRSGTADIVEAVPVSQAALLDEETITEVPMPRTNTLYLNTGSGPFRDPALRAAARDAIDRAALVEGVYEGRADQAEGLLGPAIPWAAERPERSGRTEAADPAGTTITLATFSDRAELPEVATALQQQLERAGFTVEQVVREYAHIEADALAGEFDAFILSRATVLDSGDPAAYMVSDFGCDGSFNISQLCDPAVDQALELAERTPSGPERRAAILQAEAAILNTDAAIPLLHERVIQGDAGNVVDSAKDPRERLLVTADTHLR